MVNPIMSGVKALGSAVTQMPNTMNRAANTVIRVRRAVACKTFAGERRFIERHTNGDAAANARFTATSCSKPQFGGTSRFA